MKKLRELIKTLSKYNINDFQCQICGIKYKRNNEGYEKLYDGISHIRYEICCSCNSMIINNMVIAIYKDLISELNECIKEYLNYKYEYVLHAIYRLSFQINNIRTYFKLKQKNQSKHRYLFKLLKC